MKIHNLFEKLRLFLNVNVFLFYFLFLSCVNQLRDEPLCDI